MIENINDTNPIDIMGDIDAKFMWIMENGSKAQKKRANTLAMTFIKRLQKINEGIENE